MQKVSRVALFTLGTICALLVIALLGVNLYVQSAGTQARIQRELSERLGGTLRIQRISVTPWWGLKLTGITMPQDDPSVPRDFLQAETFRLRVRITSLFAQRLVINEVSLIRPTVVWAQNADGKWRLPVSLPSDEVEVAPPPPSAPKTVPQTTAPAGPRSDVAATDAELPPEETTPFTPEVRKVKLTDGSFRFLDANKRPVATFEGVRFQSSFRSGTALRGNASIARTSLRDRFFLEELRSPLQYDPTELDFSDIRARAAGGEITGRFTMQPGDVESPFKVMVKFRNLEVDRIVTDAHGPEGMVRGHLDGHLDAGGKTADANALSGAGEIHLRDGEVRQYSLLLALGQLLQIDELKQLRFDEAHVKYHIDPGVVTVDQLLLSSANIRLSAAGTISFSGELRLDSQLAINDRIRGQLFRPIQHNFQPTDQPGFASVKFQVTGTVERPKTDLMDKIVGPELKSLTGVLSRLLGGKSERRNARDKPEEDAAAPEPAAAAPSAPRPQSGVAPPPANPPTEAPKPTGTP